MPIETKFRAEQHFHPQEPQGPDFGDWNSWQQVYDVVEELRLYDARSDAATVLGLPEATPWEDIETYLVTQDRIYYARQYGLPEDSSTEFIDAHMQENRSGWLRAKATGLGLSPNASIGEIHEAERRNRAEQAGISTEASWHDIYRAEREARRRNILDALGMDNRREWDWEEVIRRALCLHSGATTEDFLQRLQEIKMWRVERLVQQLEAKTPVNKATSSILG